MARLWLHLARWVGAGALDRTDNPPTLANERNLLTCEACHEAATPR